MKVCVKVYGLLADYLPDDAVGNEVDLEVPDDATPQRVLMRLGLPAEHCHRVLVNGAHVAPAERGSHPLEDGDHIAVWPEGEG